jgi:ankyrin repeat protein
VCLDNKLTQIYDSNDLEAFIGLLTDKKNPLNPNTAEYGQSLLQWLGGDQIEFIAAIFKYSQFKVDIEAGDIINRTPLMVALHSFDYKMVDILLENGADQYARDNFNTSILEWLKSNRITDDNIDDHNKTLMALTKHGVDINQVLIEHKKLTYIHSIASGSLPIRLFKGCLEAGVDFTVINSYGDTLLEYLIGGLGTPYAFENFKLFHKAGASITHRNNQGRTILTIVKRMAAQKRNLDIKPELDKILKYLKEHNAPE